MVGHTALARLRSSLRCWQRAIVAVGPSGQVVGFARAITDGLCNGYLSVVVVAPELRRQGIGRALGPVNTTAGRCAA